MSAPDASPVICRLPGLLLLALVTAWPGLASRAADAPLVAAAASLRNALPEIAAAYAAGDAGVAAPRLSFSSSGNLFRQIRQGAPYELFLSADEALVLALAQDGYARNDGIVYGVGRLALLLPEHSSLLPDGTLADLESALVAGRVRRFAIANPEHAPYGRAAREVLVRRGLWAHLSPRLVLGENVAQAAQFALSGGADGGIVAYALALAPAVAMGSRHALVPEQWHAPLRQRMVLLDGASEPAEHFFEYLKGDQARRILARYGILSPEGRNP